jgi:CheY-like chemotaxis protein
VGSSICLVDAVGGSIYLAKDHLRSDYRFKHPGGIVVSLLSIRQSHPNGFFMVLKMHQFKRVLIVDDDAASLFLARLTLEDMQVAREVVSLQSAGEALHLLRSNCMNEQASGQECPDLILLDINMPIMDGFEFLECLSALGQQSLINRVVVALTSSNSPRDRERMQGYGVLHFIVKPLTEEKILELWAT